MKSRLTDRNFTDYASGGSTDRPELRELIGYARAGDRIRVASIDRLARSTHDLHELIHFFTGEGIGVEFVKEGLKFEPAARCVADGSTHARDARRYRPV